ncbi:MAG: hypothetical protein ACFFD2_09835 [Promethearchaeota archaeon]
MSLDTDVHYDFLFKVLLVGAEEPIKTGLLWAFTGSNNIISDYKPTIGVNFGISSVYLNECTIKLQIWDISYDPRVRYLRPLYFKGASGCIMAIRNLKDAQYLLKELKHNTSKPIPIFFILINNEINNSQFNKFVMEYEIEIVDSGFKGIEWLTEAMLSYQRTKMIKKAAIYTFKNNETQETIQDLYFAQIRNERERFKKIREKRFKQLVLIKETLNYMDIPVENDTVRFLSSAAFFVINILTGNVDIFPLKCEECKKTCKKHRRLCIIPASEGYSDTMDKESLLIVSKIYAIINNQLPSNVIDQIKSITYCISYYPKGH